MNVVTLASLVDRLPPGRARSRYERLLTETGGEMVAVTVPYVDGPLWLVTGKAQAQALTARGVPRWRVWTLGEVNSVLEACGATVDTVAAAVRLLGSPPP